MRKNPHADQDLGADFDQQPPYKLFWSEFGLGSCLFLGEKWSYFGFLGNVRTNFDGREAKPPERRPVSAERHGLQKVQIFHPDLGTEVGSLFQNWMSLSPMEIARYVYVLDS